MDYEHVKIILDRAPGTFAERIGKLIKTLKENGVTKFASISPFDDEDVQSHYMALSKSYGSLIDYVNFQFYAYLKGTTVNEFIEACHQMVDSSLHALWMLKYEDRLDEAQSSPT
ncbi:hypothetical protein PIB30_069479 [Stylosanthes scabra]|uniref:Uncharacterized protein n=1 Tax=Stylosanthes scabra TaxID=79078 RepID=A0ABU6WR05_9FABA|nr:hypothetical protein [Stylosanthes scabra]